MPGPCEAEATCRLCDSALLYQTRHLTEDVAPQSALVFRFRC